MKRVALISLILGTALALVPVASSMVLDGGSGGGGGLAVVAPGGVQLTGQNLAAFYDTGAVVTAASAPDPNGVTIHTDTLGGNGSPSAAPAATTGDSFNWSPVLAATLTGMLILAAAATMTTRRRHRLSY
jgi:hypothetical protein